MAEVEGSLHRKQGKAEWSLGLGLAFLLAVPFLMAPVLARSLDAHSFAGFWIGLSLVVALSTARLGAEGVVPRSYVALGLASVAALQVVDILSVWRATPLGEAGYASAFALAKLILVLELPAIALVTARPLRTRGDLRPLIAWGAPGAGLALLAELAPHSLLSLAFGPGHDGAVYLRPLTAAMLLAVATAAAVQVLLKQRRIWWVSRAVPIALVAVPVAILLGQRPGSVALVMLAAQGALFLAVAIPAILALTAGPHGRVLFLAWRDLAHPDGAGSEVFVHEVGRRLVSRGFGVSVFCSAYASAERSLSVEGVRYLRRGGRYTVYLWAAAYQFVGRFRGDDVIVDVQNGIPFFTPLYCSRDIVALVHHICQEQWDLSFPPRTARLGAWLETSVAPRLYASARFVAVSESTMFDLTRIGIDPRRIDIVYNGTPRISEVAASKTVHPSICFLGRLVPHKRVELLLEAAVRLRYRFPALTIKVIGVGWWEPRLREVARELGVTDFVQFVGWANEEAKARLLRESWVLAMPSAREGWGLAVMEAAAAGTPAVAFRVGGLAESVVDGETGLLADDFDQFVSGLARLLSDSDLVKELGGNARHRALTFTWETAADRFEAVLRNQEHASPIVSAGVPVRLLP